MWLPRKSEQRSIAALQYEISVRRSLGPVRTASLCFARADRARRWNFLIGEARDRRPRRRKRYSRVFDGPSSLPIAIAGPLRPTITTERERANNRRRTDKAKGE